MQFGCLWVQNKISGSISKKKSNLNSSNLEKRYQITILCLLSIFQTWDLKKSLVKIPGDQYRFEKSKKSKKTWNFYLLDRKMSKMPLLSRDTDITKFGGENVQKQIISLLIAFFNIRTSNHKHTRVEHIPNINFVFYPVKSGVLPILQECPRV